MSKHPVIEHKLANGARTVALFCLCMSFVLLLVSCGGSGGSSSSEPTPAPVTKPNTKEPVATLSSLPQRLSGDITLSGYITFDSVPHTSTGALDFAAAKAKAARGVSVVLLDGDDAVLRETKTNDKGYYESGGPAGTEVRVVALAELVEHGLPAWNFTVIDNTEKGAQYSLVGELLNVDIEQQRDLHAVSGWDSVSMRYADERHRPAAPFAILDATYQVLSALSEVDSAFELPAVNINWSYRNTASAGEPRNGFIGSSKYDLVTKEVFVLGDAYNDSDEYDYSVIQHELAHFIEDTLSRTDNPGGSHSLGIKHDLRVAYGEGLANAFTAIVTQQPYYIDSAGTQAFYNLKISLEENNFKNAGWYSENSIGKIIYDIADKTNESGDTLSLGLAGLYDVLVNDSYVNSEALTSIYLFADVFNQVHGEGKAQSLRAMLQNERIYGVDRFGENELNDGGVASALPVYRSVTQGESIVVCSTNQAAEFNGLGVSNFVRVNVTSSGAVSFFIRRTSGANKTNPDARLYYGAGLTTLLDSLVIDSERSSFTLSAGSYVLEVYDNNNADDMDSTGGKACFNVSVM